MCYNASFVARIAVGVVASSSSGIAVVAGKSMSAVSEIRSDSCM